MAVDNVNVFPPDPLIWMCLSAFKKASVILDNHTQQCYFSKCDQLPGKEEADISSHGLDDVAHRMLVGSLVQAVSHVEHVVQVAHFLETQIKADEKTLTCSKDCYV